MAIIGAIRSEEGTTVKSLPLDTVEVVPERSRDEEEDGTGGAVPVVGQPTAKYAGINSNSVDNRQTRGGPTIETLKV